MQWRRWCWRWWVGRNSSKLMFRAVSWAFLPPKAMMRINVHRALSEVFAMVLAKGSWKSASQESHSPLGMSLALCCWALSHTGLCTSPAWQRSWHLEISYHHCVSVPAKEPGEFRHSLCDIPGTSQRKAEVLARECPTSWTNQMARSHICGTEKTESSVKSLWHWGCELSQTWRLQQHPLGGGGQEVDLRGGKKAV